MTTSLLYLATGDDRARYAFVENRRKNLLGDCDFVRLVARAARARCPPRFYSLADIFAKVSACSGLRIRRSTSPSFCVPNSKNTLKFSRSCATGPGLDAWIIS